jgi:mitochondrial fission protein ELM1
MARRRLPIWRALVLGDGYGQHGQQTGAERQALALASSLLTRAHARSSSKSTSGWSIRTDSLAAVQHPMPRLFRLLPEDPVRRQIALHARRIFFAPHIGQLVPHSLVTCKAIPSPFDNPDNVDGDWSKTIVMAAGSAPSAAAIMYRDAMPGARLVQVLLPTRRPAALARFDVVVTPAHDFSPGEAIPENVVQTKGSLHDISAPRLDAHAERYPSEDVLALPRPRVAVLLGGPRGGLWRRGASELWNDAAATRLASSVAALAGSSGSVVLTVSRRTPPSFALRLQRELGKALGGSSRVLYDDGSLRSRYLFLLASSDALVVTGDSTNMISEAIVSDAPVFIAGSSGSKRLDRFTDVLATDSSNCVSKLERNSALIHPVNVKMVDDRRRKRRDQARSEWPIPEKSIETSSDGARYFQQVDHVAELVCARLHI